MAIEMPPRDKSWIRLHNIVIFQRRPRHTHERGLLMNISTFVGLDVHARSVSAYAFNPFTGECKTKTFGYDACEIAQWIDELDQPAKAVYESGRTGFDLAKQLIKRGINCCIGAVSKIPKSQEQKIKKNDKADAEYLARMLAMGNIKEVYIPDDECEGARNLARAFANSVDDVVRAKHRFRSFLQIHGYVCNEKTPTGNRKSNWTKGYWNWAYSLKFNSTEDLATFNYYAQKVKDAEKEKEMLERLITNAAQSPRWKPYVDALCLIKGIKTITAFTIAVEIDDFTRFRNARAIANWLGLTPSEHSSGDSCHQGYITKARNRRLRKYIVEAAKHFTFATNARQRVPKDNMSSYSVRKHADKCNVRLKARRDHFEERGLNNNKASVAIARELIQWVWVIGMMVEKEQNKKA